MLRSSLNVALAAASLFLPFMTSSGSADLVSIKTQIRTCEIEITSDPIGMTLGRAITGNTCRNRCDYVRPRYATITSFTVRDRGSDPSADSAPHDGPYPTTGNRHFEEVESTSAQEFDRTRKLRHMSEYHDRQCKIPSIDLDH